LDEHVVMYIIQVNLYSTIDVVMCKAFPTTLLKTYKKFWLLEDAMIPYDDPVYDFSGERVSIRGYIDLHTTFGEGIRPRPYISGIW